MASDPQYALRLTFAYQGAQIRLARSERIAMIVPAPIGAPPQSGQSGYWLEVLDASGRVIYHRTLASPIRIDVEAFSPDRGGQSITRVPIASREGEFAVLIPDVADAQTFRISGPADPGRPDEPAGELVRLDVDALRRKSPQAQGTPTPPPQGNNG